MRRVALVAMAAALMATLLPLGSAARAAPKTPGFGPLVEGYAPYKGQSKCSPSEKPGMVAFKKLLIKTYGSRWIGIGRACNVGGKSEHKEGRALDWSMNASKKADRRKVNNLTKWLFATDKYGNRHAMARRLGIMYVIWNRKWWTTWNRGWETYCVQKPRGCVSPRDGGLNHPHADHVHFSFSWDSARKRTSHFMKQRSFVMGMSADADGSGYWLSGGDGSVHGYQAPGFGSRVGTFPKQHFVSMAATPSGRGYWLLMRRGKVHRFGDAVSFGSATTTAVDIAPTPSGNGYWILAKDGAIHSFGDAQGFGRPRNKGAMVGMAPIPSGNGYWVFGRDGRVHAFGDAGHHGDLAGQSVPVVDGAGRGGGGYWLLQKGGMVKAFGSATHHGNATGVAGLLPVRAIVATPSRGGYWVAGRNGKVVSFGDAVFAGSLT